MHSKLDDGDSLARRLRLAREQAGLSQGQVAKLLSMHRPTITTIEGGKRRVTTGEVARFADLYRVSVEWLLDRQETTHDAAVELAARELAQLKPDDLDSLMNLIKRLKRKGDGSER